mgnify:CR=1 FL=1
MRLDPVCVTSGEGRHSNERNQKIAGRPVHGIEARRFDAVGGSEVMCERSCERLNNLRFRVSLCSREEKK